MQNIFFSSRVGCYLKDFKNIKNFYGKRFFNFLKFLFIVPGSPNFPYYPANTQLVKNYLVLVTHQIRSLQCKKKKEKHFIHLKRDNAPTFSVSKKKSNKGVD